MVKPKVRKLVVSELVGNPSMSRFAAVESFIRFRPAPASTFPHSICYALILLFISAFAAIHVRFCITVYSGYSISVAAVWFLLVTLLISVGILFFICLCFAMLNAWFIGRRALPGDVVVMACTMFYLPGIMVLQFLVPFVIYFVMFVHTILTSFYTCRCFLLDATGDAIRDDARIKLSITILLETIFIGGFFTLFLTTVV